MPNQDFIDEYSILLIKQYWEKQKAKAEIELLMSKWADIFDFSQSWDYAFDIDSATGDRLDKIGSIVDLRRNADGQSFSDDDYRFFLKVKIANNVVVGTMLDDLRLSIQDVVQFAFGGLAHVKDNYDMTLSMFVDYGVPAYRVETIRRLNLLPKPAGVRYELVAQLYDTMLRVNGTKALRLSNGKALRITYTQIF